MLHSIIRFVSTWMNETIYNLQQGLFFCILSFSSLIKILGSTHYQHFDLKIHPLRNFLGQMQSLLGQS